MLRKDLISARMREIRQATNHKPDAQPSAR